MPTTRVLDYGDRGDAVARLQKLLNEGRFRAPRRRLERRRRVRPAHGLGLPAGEVLGRLPARGPRPYAGPRLLALLAGKQLPTPEMRARRKARAAKAAAAEAARPLRLRALELARRDLGLREGANNKVKFNAWWTGGPGDGAPYCVRAGSYWYAKAGSEVVDPRAGRYEGTDILLADAKAGRHDLHLTGDPDPGCGFVIDFDGRSDPDHFGLYVCDLGGGLFRSLEANATLPDGSQGVGYHVRAYRNCWFVVFER